MFEVLWVLSFRMWHSSPLEDRLQYEKQVRKHQGVNNKQNECGASTLHGIISQKNYWNLPTPKIHWYIKINPCFAAECCLWYQHNGLQCIVLSTISCIQPTPLQPYSYTLLSCFLLFSGTNRTSSDWTSSKRWTVGVFTKLSSCCVMATYTRKDMGKYGHNKYEYQFQTLAYELPIWQGDSRFIFSRITVFEFRELPSFNIHRCFLIQ